MNEEEYLSKREIKKLLKKSNKGVDMGFSFEKLGLQESEVEATLKKGIKYDDLLAEYEALKKESLFKGILDCSTAMITYSNHDGNLEYISPACKVLLQKVGGDGFNVELLIGNKLSSLIADPSIIENLNQAAYTGGIVEFEFKDHILQLQAKPVVDERGNHIGRVSVWSDVTDERKALKFIIDPLKALEMGDFSCRITQEFDNKIYEAVKTAINALGDNLN
ncbi:PAS domain-containing protein, partial [Sulfuricurvum sp.]|uniref:PAS domain-containing protein n=1 Tax=Sulfuricurvum sp. TaxID=2025608 RepID=UPI0019889415